MSRARQAIKVLRDAEERGIKQCRGRMAQVQPVLEECSFCALGVLALQMTIDAPGLYLFHDDGVFYKKTDEGRCLPLDTPDIMQYYSIQNLPNVVELNDDKLYSFAEIADELSSALEA